jgi:hypothetical protein
MNPPAPETAVQQHELLLYFTLLELSIIVLAGRVGGWAASRLRQSATVGDGRGNHHRYSARSLLIWMARSHGVRVRVSNRPYRALADPLEPGIGPADVPDRP